MTGTDAAPDAGRLAQLFDHGGASASCHRILSVPRGSYRDTLSLLRAPLVAAWGRGSRVFSCWWHRGDGCFESYVGGTNGFPASVPAGGGDGAGARLLLFPPGATSADCGTAAATLAGVLGGLPWWQRIAGFADTVQEPVDEDLEAIESFAPFLAGTPFALLTVGVALAPSTIGDVRRDDASRLHDASMGIERGGASRVGDSLAARYEETTTAIAAGLWRVHAFVGGGAPEDVQAIASLWSAATRGTGPVRHRFAPYGEPGPFEATIRVTAAPSDPLEPSTPFQLSSTSLAWLCRSPVVELPGIEARAINPFDVAAPPVAEATSIDVGRVIGRAGVDVGRLRIPLSSLGKHGFVHGATGAGKSQATRHLLTELSRAGIPWLVLEPAKREYASGMQQRLDAIRDELPDPELATVHVIRAGDPQATPVSVNPLEPEPGFPYQVHLSTVVDLMIASFDAESPFPEVLTQAIERCVLDAGWDPVLSAPQAAIVDRFRDGALPAFPVVDDLVRACHAVIEEKGYSREIAGNVRGFVDMRLGTLGTGAKRATFVDGYPISMGAVLRRNVVVEMQDLGTDADRALFMGLLLARLNQAVRLREATDPAGGRVRNVVCVEEAHRLLRNPELLSRAAARAVESFTDLLAEVRSSGVALLVAEQIPSKISSDVIKNTAVKFMGRTPAEDDRVLVGGAIGLTPEQSGDVVSLAPGEFAVHADGFDHPVKVRFDPHPEDALGVDGADPAVLVTPLPSAMGTAAAPGALTQRDLALAAQLLRHPQFRFLAEVATVAFLRGVDVPVVRAVSRGALLAGVSGDGHRAAVDLAVGRAVTDAVSARRLALGRYAPGALLDELAPAVRASLLEGRTTTPAVRWLGLAAQSHLMSTALKALERDAPAHPDTERWVEDWGVPWMAAPTAFQQRVALFEAFSDAPDAGEVALLGGTSPGVLERLLASRGGGPDAAVADLGRCLEWTPRMEDLMKRIANAARDRREGAAGAR